MNTKIWFPVIFFLIFLFSLNQSYSQVSVKKEQKTDSVEAKPFHGMVQLAKRNGWYHAEYFLKKQTVKYPSWHFDFENTDNVEIFNKKKPGEFLLDEKTLLIRLLSDEEQIKDTSVAIDIKAINLDHNPYLVIELSEVSHKFAMKLVNIFLNVKSEILSQSEKPGLIIINIVDRLRWNGSVPLKLILYSIGEKSHIRISGIKITGSLTEKEKKVFSLQQTKKSVVIIRNNNSKTKLPIFNPISLTQQIYLSERLVYFDSVTNNMVWRLTNHPAIDKVIYYDIAHWNNNGSKIRWASTRGGNRQWLMDANGSNLMSLDLRTGIFHLDSHWSHHDPEIMYYSKQDINRTTINSVNIRTFNVKEIADLDEPEFSMIPQHPDDSYFILNQRNKKQNMTVFYLLGKNQSLQKFDFGRFVHRLRFTKAATHDIFYNFDNPRTQWAMSANGKMKLQLTGDASHPDWSWDGKWMYYYEDNQLKKISRDGQQQEKIADLGAGGHGSIARDNRTFVSDIGNKGLYKGQILYIDVISKIVHPVCLANSSYYNHENYDWHPDHHSTHPHPHPSPDGTKTIFSSDFFSKYTDVFVAVNRLPDEPTGLKFKWEKKKLYLIWTSGENNRETAGYNIWAANQSGGPYRLVNEKLVNTTSFLLQKRYAFYCVTAVEHSGLQSLPAPEIKLSKEWKGRVVKVYEAENTAFSGDFRPFMDARNASGMYFLATDKHKVNKDDAAKVKNIFSLYCLIPKDGTYTIQARVRGKGKIVINGQSLIVSKNDMFYWVNATKKFKYSAGKKKLSFQLTDGDVHIDQIIITNDQRYRLKGMYKIDDLPPQPVNDLNAQGLDPFTVKLSWAPSQSADTDYYNVYVSETKSYRISQEFLIGSPVETFFIDWGLQSDKTYYYSVISVDYTGNRSKPMQLAIKTDSVRLTTVPVEAEKGKFSSNVQIKGSKQASDFKFIQFPAKQRQGSAWITFDVPFESRFAIWAKIMPAEPEATPLSVEINGLNMGKWKITGPVNKWGWDFIGPQTSANPRLYSLKKGRHILKITGSGSQKIDQIVVSNDPTYKNNGFYTVRRINQYTKNGSSISKK